MPPYQITVPLFDSPLFLIMLGAVAILLVIKLVVFLYKLLPLV